MGVIKNNKGFTAIIVSIVLIMLGGIIYIDQFTDSGKDESTEVSLNDSVNKVSVEDVKENMAKDDVYAFILADDTCPACIMFKNNLKQLVKDEGIKLDYIDLQVEDRSEVENLLVEDLEYDLSQGISTPTTFIIEDGEVTSTIVGAVEVDDLLADHGDEIRALNDEKEQE